jgi:hypothetical protein
MGTFKPHFSHKCCKTALLGKVLQNRTFKKSAATPHFLEKCCKTALLGKVLQNPTIGEFKFYTILKSSRVRFWFNLFQKVGFAKSALGEKDIKT